MNLSKKNHSDHWYSSLKKISQLEKHLTVYCLVLAYCILYPYSPFEDLGNSRGLNLPILQQLWNSMGRAIIYNYLSIIIPWDTSRGMPFLCINVYIPYWKFRSMLFLCIMYTILKFQRQEVCEIYQNALNSRREHKTMTSPRGPFNYHMEIQGVRCF